METVRICDCYTQASKQQVKYFSLVINSDLTGWEQTEKVWTEGWWLFSCLSLQIQPHLTAVTLHHANKKQTNKKQIMWVDGLQSNRLHLALITSRRRLYQSFPAAPVRSRSNSINGFGVSVGPEPDPCRDAHFSQELHSDTIWERQDVNFTPRAQKQDL